MALSSRLAVSGQISAIIRPDIRYYQARYPVLSGRISGIIRPDIRYYLAGYPVLSGRISGIIWPHIRYYPAGYPVKQLAGYPAGYANPAVKNCRISGFVSISRISGYPAKSLSGTSLISMGCLFLKKIKEYLLLEKERTKIELKLECVLISTNAFPTLLA